MVDDMFAVSDEDQDGIKPTESAPSTAPRSYTLSTDMSKSKRKADSEAEGGAADIKKWFRVTGTSHWPGALRPPRGY